MKALNILSIDKIFKINQAPINDKLVGSPLASFTKEVYYSYEGIDIRTVEKMPEKNKFVINGKYDLPFDSRNTNPEEGYFSSEEEVVAMTIALNETVQEAIMVKQERLKEMFDFLEDAIKLDKAASAKLPK